jgi:Electron transfer DM13
MQHLHKSLSAFALLGVLFACGKASPPTAPDAAPVVPGTGPVGPGVSGRFTKVQYDVTGTATLAVENGVAKLDISSDFGIMQTPGPFVYLNTTGNPNSGQPLRVGALKSLRGAQTYTFQVPAGVRYTHVLIWCDPFNVGMAQAQIPATP